MEKGLKGKKEILVDTEMTARKVGSGSLDVLATPCMIALMEGTAEASVQKELAEGQGTVGTSVSVRHLAATPVGLRVTCETELLEVNGRELCFSVKAYDERELIGEGTHTRFIIDNERFFQKAMSKSPDRSER